MNKLIRMIDRAIDYVATVFFLFLMLIGIYAFYDSYQIYDHSKIPVDILNLKPKDNDPSTLEDLREINEDIVGWIKINNTNIDYPVLYGKDNSEYINRDYKKNFSTGGSIFLDYRNNRDLEDDYSIIYGHNILSNQMFAELKNYADNEFFKSHQDGEIYTTNTKYELHIIAYAVINSFLDRVYNLTTNKNYNNHEVYVWFKQNAKIFEEYDYDKLLLLSTCDSAGSTNRIVILASLKDVLTEKEQE